MLEMNILLPEEKRLIDTFLLKYMENTGIQLHMLRAACPDFPGFNGEQLVDFVAALVESLTGAEDPPAPPTLEVLVENATSLALLVEYARRIDPLILPRDIIPSSKVVENLLKRFHHHMTSQDHRNSLLQ